MNAYRIRDWPKLYENNRTRDMVRMEWVPIPNRHDGDGFSELLDHPDGMAHFGAWVLMVQVASKCETRGMLTRRLGDQIVPHDERSLARQTHSDVAVYATAIPRLLQIGWLEQVTVDEQAPQESRTLAAVSPHPARTQPTMEGNGTERNGREGSAHPPAAHPPAAHPPAEPITAEAILADPESRWPYVRKEPWAVALAAVVDTKIGRNNWPQWKRLVDLRGLAAVVAAAEGLPSVARWPNRVEDALPPVVEAPPPDLELGQAAALIRAHGWEACRDAVGFHDAKQIPDAVTLARALDCNRPALRKLLAHYDAQQGVA